MPPPTSHQLNPVNSLCAINWIHSIYYVHTAITPFYSFVSTVANTFELGLSSHLSFPGGKVVKNLPANAGETRDTASMLGSGRSPGGGKATHSSILAWKIPRTEEPGGLTLDTTEHSPAAPLIHLSKLDSIPALPPKLYSAVQLT